MIKGLLAFPIIFNGLRSSFVSSFDKSCIPKFETSSLILKQMVVT